MRFEQMLEGARNGKKYRTPNMGNSYIAVASVKRHLDNAVAFPRLVLVSDSGTYVDFSFSAFEIMEEDWVEAEPIVKVKMYADSYKIACPRCNKVFQVGISWETRVGDIYKCTCGNQLLLEPPKDIECATPKAANISQSWIAACGATEKKEKQNMQSQWPKA